VSDQEHQHVWRLPDGPYVVIDTNPPQEPYSCECGAFTHDPKTGEPCPTCHLEDYARRSSRRVTLRGGPLNNTVIAEPGNGWLWFRVDSPEKRAQKIVQYRRSEGDPTVYDFYCNAWTLPVVPLGDR
jgi:hypothetical protein